VQVLLDGIFKGGTKNDALREDLKDQARQYGKQCIYDKLKEMDPEAAGKIHSNDLRRVIRALEICMTEKIAISQLQKNRKGLWGAYDIRLFALGRGRQELYQLIDARVEHMFRNGIVDEIKKLNGIPWGKTAEKIIGIPEVQGFLHGQYDLEETKNLIKLNTRHLAKRQLTWFRREKRLEWITIGAEDAPETISKTILEQWIAGEKDICAPKKA
jgi:tRNA dimethylallyltransferase